MQRDRLSYLLLVACIEDWARRNQPGLMVTSGVATASVNCELLTTLHLPPDLVATVRSAMGLPSTPTTPAATILAHGAENIVSSGAIPFLLVAGADLHP